MVCTPESWWVECATSGGGGNEVAFQTGYEVLTAVSEDSNYWTDGGVLPERPLEGGWVISGSETIKLYLCGTRWESGQDMILGKLWKGSCNIGWHGKEYDVGHAHILGAY